ncbi:MAG: hypothetical protein KF887_08855 [Paracoccaceae bacterium]|nr:MAG: hypothetical protein KF887_08855 [Paracoccaceae bacterium]
MVNFAFELVKNEPTAKQFTNLKEPRQLAKIWNRRIDPLIYEAVGQFLEADKFFQVVGDKPMPKVTPQGFGDVIKMLINAKTKKPAKEADVLKRLEDNALLKFAMRKGYGSTIINMLSAEKLLQL